MKSGRELDALIAEKVMGLIPWPEQDPKWECKAFTAPVIFGYQTLKPCIPPNYSTDIGVAWQVIDKIQEIAYPVCIEFNSDKWHCAGYLKNHDSTGAVANPLTRYFSFSAETPAHAICLAALKLF